MMAASKVLMLKPENDATLPKTQVVEGVTTVMPITAVEDKAQRRLKGNLQMDLQDKRVIDSGCSRHMIRNMSYLTEYKEIDEGYVAFVGNPKGGEKSLNSKAFKVFNGKTRIVEENLHIRFSESTPNVVGSGPGWLFNIDALTRTMNYEPLIIGTQSNGLVDNELPFDPTMFALKDVGTFDFSNEDEDDDVMADMNNLDTTIQVSPTPTTRIHKDHPLDQVTGDLHSATKTRNMLKNLEEHGFVSTVQQRTNHKDL
nr:hypothetical protein [Tanacetum cinerariifolium]